MTAAAVTKRSLTEDDATRIVTEVAKTCPKIPALITQHTRCGKPQCRCAAGHLHGPYHYLRWREGRFHRRRYVRLLDVPVVQAILEQRRMDRDEARQDEQRALQTWRQLTRIAQDAEARIRHHQEEP